MNGLYYLFLFVPPNMDSEQVKRETELLRLAFDYLSEDKNYRADYSYVYSGSVPIYIVMRLSGLDLNDYVERKNGVFFYEKYPRLRLWTLDDGFVFPVEKRNVKFDGYISDGKGLSSWKGKNYRGDGFSDGD